MYTRRGSLRRQPESAGRMSAVAAPAAGQFAAGTTVEVYGLKGAPQHNGAVGQILKYRLQSI